MSASLARPDEVRTAMSPVLELRGARPDFGTSGLPPAPIELRLRPGDCVQIVTRGWREANALADLCNGMLAPQEGSVVMQGLDWTRLPGAQAAALRGRIGRIHHRGAWNGLSPVSDSILLPQLHHTRRDRATLIAEALRLCGRFGLPGLPMERPERLNEPDLARAACVRAFLGQPALLLLDPPVVQVPDVLPAFLAELTEAREAGAAALCFTRHLDLGEGAVRRSFGACFNHRLILNDDGLRPLRRHEDE